MKAILVTMIAAETIFASPLLEYRFEEAFGLSVANTGTIDAARGTLEQNAAFSPDVPECVDSNSSLYLDGSPLSYVDVPDDFDYTNDGSKTGLPVQALTIEAWIKPDRIDGQRFIWDDYGTPGALLAITSGAGQFSVTTGDEVTTDTTVLTATDAIVTGNWQHLAGVYDGHSLRIYINGLEAGTPEAASGNIVDQSTTYPGQSAYIGYTAGDSQSFAGLVDELRVHNVAVSQSELARGHFGTLDLCRPKPANFMD